MGFVTKKWLFTNFLFASSFLDDFLSLLSNTKTEILKNKGLWSKKKEMRWTKDNLFY
jgi:hypothetical protein